MKRLIFLLLMVSSGISLADFGYENRDVAPRAIAEWIDACEREMDIIHGFVLMRHGRIVAEGSWRPFDTLNEPHMLFSHSKSFTSTAIGMLADEGKVDLDERVAEIFADKVPEAPSENLRQLRVRDLLTMNVGARRTDAENDDVDGDWERAFLANTFDGEPGREFRYDSGATYMLASIVERRSGKRLMEFLRERMFDKIGIRKAWSTTSPTGTACGGWGMNMTTREMALFGQLLLQGGIWNGERIVSSQWLALATAMQTKSGPIVIAGQDGSDWHRGYGFQFWRCKNGFYRADGANGQFTIVMLQYDAVLSISAGEVRDTQRELDLVWKYLVPGFKDRLDASEKKDLESVRRRCADLAVPPVAGRRVGATGCVGREFALQDNVRGIRSVRLDEDADGWICTIDTRAGKSVLPVGFGTWKEGALTIDASKHEPLGSIVGRQAVAGSAAVGEDGVMRLRILLKNGPQRIDAAFSDESGVCRMSGELKGIGGCKLAGKE